MMKELSSKPLQPAPPTRCWRRGRRAAGAVLSCAVLAVATDATASPTTYDAAVRQFVEATEGPQAAAALWQQLDQLAKEAERSGQPLHVWFFREGGFVGVRALSYDQTSSLTDIVSNRRGPCLSLASAYLALAERLGADSSPVATPRHVFIRETHGGQLRNVELLEGGRERADSSYLAQEHAPPGDSRAAGLLRALSPPQFLAYLLNNHAVGLRGDGDARGAARAYRSALRRDPECQPCLYNHANLLAAAGKQKKALRLYDRALKLHPWDEEARRNRQALLRPGSSPASF